MNINTNDIMQALFQTIESRKTSPVTDSYTASLLAKGAEKINSKILEEAAEVCEAGLENDNTHLLHEIADLLYHTFVLAAFKDISLADIEAELSRRFGKSGLAEKAERKGKD